MDPLRERAANTYMEQERIKEVNLQQKLVYWVHSSAPVTGFSVQFAITMQLKWLCPNKIICHHAWKG